MGTNSIISTNTLSTNTSLNKLQCTTGKINIITPHSHSPLSTGLLSENPFTSYPLPNSDAWLNILPVTLAVAPLSFGADYKIMITAPSVTPAKILNTSFVAAIPFLLHVGTTPCDNYANISNLHRLIPPSHNN